MITVDGDKMFLFTDLHGKGGKKVQSNRSCRHYALDVRNVPTADVVVITRRVS